MATRRRAQPKKRSSAKHRSARVAKANPRAGKHSPASCARVDPDESLDDTRPAEVLRLLEGDPQPNVPHGTSELDDELIGDAECWVLRHPRTTVLSIAATGGAILTLLIYAAWQVVTFVANALTVAGTPWH